MASQIKILNERPKVFEGEYLSVSKVKTFKDCKSKFRYGYIEKLPRKEWDFHVFGKFAHGSLEYYHDKILKGDNRLDNEIMTDSFKLAVNDYKNKLLPSQKKEVKSMMLNYLELMRNEKNPPKILGVEDNFYIDIDGKVLLNGFIDRVQLDHDGVLHVIDYKTSKSKSFLKNDFMQLKTYAFVKCLEDPTLERVRTSYMMLRHKFSKIEKEFTRKEVMEMEGEFLKYAEDIQAEKLWRPSTSRLCAYCDYIDNCDDGKKFLNIGNASKFGAIDW